MNDATTYEKPSSPCSWPNGPICSLLKASEVLYNLNSDVVDRILAARAMNLEYLKTSLQVSAAFVAHTILHASPHVHSAVPVRIVAGQPATPTSIFQALDSWALVLGVYSSNSHVVYTLLPLQLEMLGSTVVHSQKHHITHYTPSWYGSHDITTKLQGLPVLRCNDVELFFERGLERHWRDSWTPR